MTRLAPSSLHHPCLAPSSPRRSLPRPAAVAPSLPRLVAAVPSLPCAVVAAPLKKRRRWPPPLARDLLPRCRFRTLPSPLLLAAHCSCLRRDLLPRPASSFFPPSSFLSLEEIASWQAAMATPSSITCLRASTAALDGFFHTSVARALSRGHQFLDLGWRYAYLDGAPPAVGPPIQTFGLLK